MLSTKSYFECKLLKQIYDAELTLVYRFQNSLFEEHKGILNDVQQMRRKNRDLMCDKSQLQQVLHQDHNLTDQNVVQPTLIYTLRKETRLWLK